MLLFAKFRNYADPRILRSEIGGSEIGWLTVCKNWWTAHSRKIECVIPHVTYRVPQVAYVWSKTLGGDSAVRLLLKLGLLEQCIDYAAESGLVQAINIWITFKNRCELDPILPLDPWSHIAIPQEVRLKRVFQDRCHTHMGIFCSSLDVCI